MSDINYDNSKINQSDKLDMIKDYCDGTECDKCLICDMCAGCSADFSTPGAIEEAFDALFGKYINNQSEEKATQSENEKANELIEKDKVIQEYCIEHDLSKSNNCDSCEINELCDAVAGNFDRNPQVCEAAYNIISKSKPAKSKVEIHKEICNELSSIYAKKNADYGDSFHISYEEEGMAMPRIRLGDKYNRFRTLTKTGDAKVKDESIRDTLIDLANYAIMTIMELDSK